MPANPSPPPLAWHERLQWRMLGAHGLVILLSALVPAFTFYFSVERWLERTLLDELESMVALVAPAVEERLRGPEESVSALLEYIEREAGLRATVIDDDGSVIADSRPAPPGGWAPHATRPEVASALARGEGRAVRYSESVGESMSYVTRLLDVGGERFVLRLAKPRRSVAEQLSGLRWAFGVALLLALVLGVAMSWWWSRRLTAPLDAMHRVAREWAAGRYDVPLPPPPAGEPSVLHQALQALRVQVGEQFALLEDETRLLLTIVGAMNEGLIVVDATGRVILINPRALELLGVAQTWTSDAVEGRLLLEVTRLTKLSELMERTIREAAPQREDVQTTRSARWLGVSSAPLREGEGVRGAVLALYDLTQVRQLERVRQDFVANVSHELRTPIAAIAGWAETLTGGGVDLPPFVHDKLVVMLSHARRLGALVDDLLVLARLESVGIEEAYVDVDWDEVIDEALGALAEVIDDKGMKVRVQVAPEVATWHTEARAVEYIVRNLLENALKYTPAGGNVWLDVGPAAVPAWVRLEVRDDGPGIAAKHLPRIFERFYRVDKGRARQVGGTGLGLSIVKHFVTALHGKIEVQSEVGRGAAFVVLLPEARGALPSEDSEDNATSP